MKPEFQHASQSFKRLNPHLFGVGAVPGPQSQSDESCPLDNASPLRKTGPSRVVVCITRFGRRLLDQDNYVGGCKPLRDAIAASFGMDDADTRIVWEYSQIKTSGEQGTAVKIDV